MPKNRKSQTETRRARGREEQARREPARPNGQTADSTMMAPAVPDLELEHQGMRDLIAGLNEDLSDELEAIVQYVTYAAKVTGPYRLEVAQLFRSEVADELGHAQFLADKIVALGGEPTTRPGIVLQADSVAQMLNYVLQAEQRAIRNYNARAEQARAAGDTGLAVRLEDIISDETTHAEEVEKILRTWNNPAG
jgi:bacterioferritin